MPTRAGILMAGTRGFEPSAAEKARMQELKNKKIKIRATEEERKREATKKEAEDKEKAANFKCRVWF